MKDIILAMPEFYLYLMFVVMSVIMALWTRQAGPPVAEPRATAPTMGRVSATSRWQYVAASTGPPCGVAPCSPSATARPFADLEATLRASYSAMLEQAIRTIRLGPPAGARPTDQAAG